MHAHAEPIITWYFSTCFVWILEKHMSASQNTLLSCLENIIDKRGIVNMYNNLHNIKVKCMVVYIGIKGNIDQNHCGSLFGE